MAPRSNRNTKRKTPLYRGMPPGFTPGTGDVPIGPLTDESKGKAIVHDDSSDEAPEEYESFSNCSKKGGPCRKRMNSLKKPNLPPMSTWSSDDYAAYDAYLIKKWEIGGWCDEDSVYVGSRDFNSKVAFTARTFYNFQRTIHGRKISQFPQNVPVPDLSRMLLWTTKDYDLYDLFLINKWKNIGWDDVDSTYASIRDHATLVYRTAENIKKREVMRHLPTSVSKTAQGKRKRNNRK